MQPELYGRKWKVKGKKEKEPEAGRKPLPHSAGQLAGQWPFSTNELTSADVHGDADPATRCSQILPFLLLYSGRGRAEAAPDRKLPPPPCRRRDSLTVKNPARIPRESRIPALLLLLLLLLLDNSIKLSVRMGSGSWPLIGLWFDPDCQLFFFSSCCCCSPGGADRWTLNFERAPIDCTLHRIIPIQSIINLIDKSRGRGYRSNYLTNFQAN